VEYLVTNANAPELILAITKELYVETMVQHGEGEGSSESTSSQASSTPPRDQLVLSQEERQRLVILHLWRSEQGLQEIAEVEEGSRRGSNQHFQRFMGIYQSITAFHHDQRFFPEWRTKRTGAKWMPDYGEFWQQLPNPMHGWTKADWNSLLIAMELRGVTDPAMAPILQEHWEILQHCSKYQSHHYSCASPQGTPAFWHA
jgi:hypothetical protein